MASKLGLKVNLEWTNQWYGGSAICPEEDDFSEKVIVYCSFNIFKCFFLGGL